MLEIVLALLLGPLLWLLGAITFDGVHWLLHRMLRSPSAWLRDLARPHAVHHAWIDHQLDTNWELQTANLWCHIVPEYLTQLVFTGAVALVLPAPFAVVLAALQTAVFGGLLWARGRDPNHRPAARIDAHPPGWSTPPSYHALHHAWPDAYFSSYTKLVDWIVGGGAEIAGRRFGWLGASTPFAEALRSEVECRGGVASDPEALPELDVLVLLDPHAPLEGPVERLIAATCDRQLPPEVWALRASAEDRIARHYLTDVRVTLRTVLVPPSSADARRSARRALFWIRRDAHFVATGPGLALAARRRFRRLAAARPQGATTVRHRLDLRRSHAGVG